MHCRLSGIRGSKLDDENKLVTIKRYSNRKLYDMSRSRYITLADLGELIRDGENIQVIDNDTKADLTEVTLTQVLMAQQRQKQKGIRNLVTSQAEILLQKLSVPMHQIRDEALRQVERQMDRFIRRPDGSTEENLEYHQPTPSMNTKIEALRTSSDEKLLALLVVQRIEQLEHEINELKRRVELIEKKDDQMY